MREWTDNDPCVRMNRIPQTTIMKVKTRHESEPTMERMASWRVFLMPHVSEEESLLVEWARGQGLTVLPHPPLLSNNFPQLLNKTLKWLDETREDGKSNKVETHGFPPPIVQGLTSPTLILSNHALFILTLHHRSWL